MSDFILGERDRGLLEHALKLWVSGHPSPYTPFVLVSGHVLSPAQLAAEMMQDSKLGRPFLEYLVDAASRTGRPVDEPIYRAIEGNQRR